MKKPKFKFQLNINENCSLFYGSKVDNSGQTVNDSAYLRTGFITRSGFKLPEFLYGRRINIAIYEVLENDVVYLRTDSINTFNAQTNSFTFIEGDQCVIIYFEKGSDRYDSKNFTTFTYNVHPVFSSLKKEIAKESSEMYLRAKLRGDIRFQNGTFDKIASLDINNKIVLNIQKFDYQQNAYKPFYQTARFTKIDCEFDYDKRTVKPKTEPDDQYTLVLSALNNEYDLVKLGATRSKTSYDIPALEQFILSDGKQVTNVIGGTFFNTEVDIPEVENQTVEQVLYNHNFYPIQNFIEFFMHTTVPHCGGIRSNFSFCYNQVYDVNTAFGPDNCEYNLVYDTSTRYIYFVDKVTNIKVARSSAQYAWQQGDSPLSLLTLAERFINVSDNTLFAFVRAKTHYNVWYRVLCRSNVTPAQGNGYFLIDEDDFAYSGTVYNRAVTPVLHTEDLPSVHASSSTSFDRGEYGLFAGTDGPDYFTNRDVIPNSQYEQGQHIIPICSALWGAMSLWVFGRNPARTNGLQYRFTNNSCFTVFSAISAILKKVAPLVKLEESVTSSEFFYSATNPIAFEQLFPLITHSSNIEAGTFNQSAQKLTIKLKDIFDLLKNALRCYWYIDSNNVMHIEHETWFLNGGSYDYVMPQLDIREHADAWNKQTLDFGHSSIAYNSNDLYKRIVLSADQDTTDACSTVEIDFYDEKLKMTDELSVSIGNFSVNVDYLFATGDASNYSDGVVFMLARLNNSNNNEQNYSLRQYIVPAEPYTDASMLNDAGQQYSIQPTNVYAMPRYLMNTYVYNFPGEELSSPAYVTRGQKRYRVQEIRVPIENELNEYGIIATRFGNGLINKISIDFDSQYADIVLLHDYLDYPYAFAIQTKYLPVVYNAREDSSFYIIYSNDSFSIFAHTPRVMISSSDSFTARLLYMLQNYTNGFEIETTFKTVNSASQLSVHSFIFNNCDLSVDNSGTFFGIAYKKVTGTTQYEVLFGFLTKNGDQVTPTQSAGSLISSNGGFVSLRMRLRLVYPNSIFTTIVASAQGNTYASSSVFQFSDLTIGQNDSLWLGTINGAPNILYKDFIIKQC